MKMAFLYTLRLSVKQSSPIACDSFLKTGLTTVKGLFSVPLASTVNNSHLSQAAT